MTNQLTDRDQIELALKLGDTVLTESGDYSTGFWHNELCVDLEELKAGNHDAFTVIEDVHDTAGTSFRAFYGIDNYAKLPNGVNNEAIIDLCASIFERRDELTAGLEIEWVNGNEKAIWYDENGDTCPPNEYWDEQFGHDVEELNSREVYDLSDSENRPYVAKGIEPIPEGVDPTDAAQVLAHVHTVGYQDDGEYIYQCHEDFARWYAEQAAEDAE